VAYFAEIENGIVINVIVADQDFINNGAVGESSQWIETDINTHGNIHYVDGTNTPDNGTPIRGNYASVGYIYDSINDVFYAPQPYSSWILNKTTWLWEAPIPMPTGTGIYVWNESIQNWTMTILANTNLVTSISGDNYIQTITTMVSGTNLQGTSYVINRLGITNVAQTELTFDRQVTVNLNTIDASGNTFTETATADISGTVTQNINGNYKYNIENSTTTPGLSGLIFKSPGQLANIIIFGGDY
jgi:hypothetical protein